MCGWASILFSEGQDRTGQDRVEPPPPHVTYHLTRNLLLVKGIL